jgi:pimeloyl-ACP methyl ester carboxylesterase
VLQAFLDGAVFGTSSGDGAPRALLLHGWRRSKEDFDRVAASLAASGIPSLSLDLPGFGASPAPTEPMGARGYADELAPLLGGLAEHGPILLVGHSFGGRVAVCLAARRPEQVAGLILTGVPLVRSAMPKASISPAYRVLRTAARLHLVPASTLEAARRRYGSSDYRNATGVMRGVLVANIAESYEPELAALRCPVTLLWGSGDSIAPLGVARAAATLADAAALEVIEGATHFVPTEAPDRLAAAAAAMLEGAR